MCCIDRLKWQQTQIGVSKFRVDLGVIHPDFPGVYLAGVECDGATYHGSPSARDRDRVRHLILENLGWQLVRLWSTDYFQDPDEAISRIDRRLKDILTEDRSKTELKEKEEEIARVEAQEQSGANSALYDETGNKSNNNSTTDPGLVETLSSSIVGDYDHCRYFDDDYKSTIIEIAKGILEEKNGITLHELALDVANLHGLSRTSKKQLDYIIDLIEPWAGIWNDGVHKTVVWSRPEDVVCEIQWRGIYAFGDEREWSEIPYPEAKGLARFALQQSPHMPVELICDIFKLKRRHEKTLAEFQSWVDDVALESGGELRS